LGKELIGNIALLRFTNRVFEPQWCNKDIESVQVIINESIGIEGRGALYEASGVLRDMVQSHMLQMLALVAMEAPEHLSGESIRDAKATVLKKVHAMSVVLGQYNGYRAEQGVAPDSAVETFAAVHLAIDNPRWQGVPFYLKTGKCLSKKETSIHLNFKPVKCLLTHDCPSDTNYLTIRIYPNEGIYLELNAKVPGQSYTVKPVMMALPFHTLYGPNTPEAYETLLMDVLKGDQSAFVREDEIELSWKIIEEIKRLNAVVYDYEPGTAGPEEVRMLDTKPIRWRA
jgi:glucose-6-phosphate 1-dehydrogenase